MDIRVAHFIRTLAAAAVLLTASAHAADITGAGATFPYPIYAKWADVYKKETGIGLNYQSIGSGGGIKQIKAKTVDFGALCLKSCNTSTGFPSKFKADMLSRSSTAPSQSTARGTPYCVASSAYTAPTSSRFQVMPGRTASIRTW